MGFANEKIGVVGAGAWGTALANACAANGLDTIIWAREPEVVRAINRNHENTVFLPDIPLHADLAASESIADLQQCTAILMVTPAQYLRSVSLDLQDHISAKTPLVICSKGIEVRSGKLMSDVLHETMPDHPIAVLSGPTFASEVARGLPCALTLAASDDTIGRHLVDMIGHATFRTYLSDDVAGAQIGGAVKNVLAIGTGIVAGLNLGENARAALITRGLAEMMRFGALFGGRRDTLMGLSGLGDLILTCSSTQSRNMSLGKAIGEGRRFADIMAERKSVAEGAHTVEILHKLARDNAIDMPITEAVHAILKEGEDVYEAMDALLSRPLTREI